MKVHLIKKQSIEDFVTHNTQSKSSFQNWIGIISVAKWNKPSDIMATFSHADILGQDSNRVIFNIGGNKYRLICKYHFGKSKVHLFVKWIGTHANYTSLCKMGNQYTINNY